MSAKSFTNLLSSSVIEFYKYCVRFNKLCANDVNDKIIKVKKIIKYLCITFIYLIFESLL